MIFYTLTYIILNVVYGIHFNGGTIAWAPINPYANSSSIDIAITQKYSWTYTSMICTTNVPVSSGRGNVNMTCVGNCSTDGGYSNTPVDILTDCTSSSTSLNMMFSQRTVHRTIDQDAHLSIAYTSNAWRDLYYPPVPGLSWSIVTRIDLRRREDGIFNTPPITNIVSPQFVIVNTTTLIHIPMFDINENDDVRCRWAVNNVNLSIDECSGICYNTGLPNDTTLSNCTLSFTGLIPNIWYAIAIQVEDFINSTSTQAMSSIPVQFLIHVISTPVCTESPVIIPLTDCIKVQIGTAMNLTLYVMNLCNSSATITDIIQSTSILGMTTSPITQLTMNDSLFSTSLLWTPQTDQLGLQEVCMIAYNNGSNLDPPEPDKFTFNQGKKAEFTEASQKTADFIENLFEFKEIDEVIMYASSLTNFLTYIGPSFVVFFFTTFFSYSSNKTEIFNSLYEAKRQHIADVRHALTTFFHNPSITNLVNARMVCNSESTNPMTIIRHFYDQIVQGIPAAGQLSSTDILTEIVTEYNYFLLKRWASQVVLDVFETALLRSQCLSLENETNFNYE